MYYLQLLDLLFFVKCLKHPSDSFNVFNHVTFHSGSMWAPKGHASPHLKETEDLRRRERPGKEREEDKEREHA